MRACTQKLLDRLLAERPKLALKCDTPRFPQSFPFHWPSQLGSSTKTPKCHRNPACGFSCSEFRTGLRHNPCLGLILIGIILLRLVSSGSIWYLHPRDNPTRRLE